MSFCETSMKDFSDERVVISLETGLKQAFLCILNIPCTFQTTQTEGIRPDFSCLKKKNASREGNFWIKYNLERLLWSRYDSL